MMAKLPRKGAWRTLLAMAVPDVQFAWSGDSAIGYQVIGDGAIDLVYMPPSFSNLDLQWEHPSHARFLERLAAFSRLIIVDRRGWGVSDRTSPGSFPPLETSADDLNAVLDAAGSNRAAVFGCVEAGWIAAIAAATYPHRYSALILYQSAVTWMRTAKTPWNNSPDDWRAEINRWRHVGTQAFAARWIEQNEPSLVDDPTAAAYLAKLMRGTIGPGGSQAGFLLHSTTDISAVLPAIRVPTLVLYRPANATDFPQNGPYLASKIENARLVALPGRDYLPWAGEADTLLGDVEEFLTGVRHVPEPDPVLASVLFTDIVDSTKKAAEIGDAAWKLLLAEHDDRIRSELARFRGREIDHTGDGFLATFDGPARAVRCAQAIQDVVRDLGIEIRAGVHTGEVELAGDQIRGIAVHIAARVAAMARGTEVLVSSTVKDLVAGSGLVFEDAGEHELKGVPDRWRVSGSQADPLAETPDQTPARPDLLLTSCSRQDGTRGHKTTPDDTGRHVELDLVCGASNLRIRWPRGRGSSSPPLSHDQHAEAHSRSIG
jgi:class 3 adenylate cyclase